MGFPVGKAFGAGAALAVAAALMAGTVAHVSAAEGNFLEMLFGVRPQPPQVQPAPSMPDAGYGRVQRPRVRLGAPRHQLRTRYAALPVKIRVSDRQTPLDMKQGAAAALLRDETLRPGDIVILNTGARVFTGGAGKRHAMSDFEPVGASPYVDTTTRRLLAGMVAPVGALPADAARRMTARLRKVAPAPAPAVAQAAAMRVINPWRTEP